MMAPYYLDACGVSTALMPVRSALPSCLCLQFCPHACVISTALMPVRSALPSCLCHQHCPHVCEVSTALMSVGSAIHHYESGNTAPAASHTTAELGYHSHSICCCRCCSWSTHMRLL